MKRYLIAISILFCITTSVCSETRIAVVISSESQNYQEALSGFQSYILDQKYSVHYKKFNISDYQNGLYVNLSEEINTFMPAIVLAVGTSAAKFSHFNIKKIPVVYSMVLNPQRIGLVNLAGVSLKIPHIMSISKVVNIFPDHRKIAFLYDTNQKDLDISALSKELDDLRIKLLPYGVSSKSELKSTIKKASKEADFVFANTDPLLYNKDSARSIIFWTLMYQVPFVAFSSNYVKAGAFISVDCDYYDIGRQSGLLASKIIQGQKSTSLKVLGPRKVKVFLNYKTAKYIGLSISKSIISKIHKVYGDNNGL